MITARKIRQKFATEELTPSTRLIAMIFALINLPLAIPALIYPIGWVIGAPGLFLLYYYFRIWADKISRNNAQVVWVGTVMYNLALMIGFGISTEMRAWPVMLFQAFAIGVSLIAYRDLNEREDEVFLEKVAETENDTEKLFENLNTEYI
ncbi:MAG: hypothetical protein R3D00_01100 [Bacteroidia bacterium]